MSVKRYAGDKGLCDLLFSRIVRSRAQCARCGVAGTPAMFHTAHICRRRYSATRCVEDNAWCLCPTCHHTVDEWASQFMNLVERTIGVRRYDELRAQAQTGPELTALMHWRTTLAALKARCEELGIDIRRKVPT